MKQTSLYIHIPYCRSKCIYCDFFSGGSRSADWKALVDSLLCELRERRCELTVSPSSIYIGGGTPSLMPADSFISLSDGIRILFPETDKCVEFTIEVNPDDVTEEMCCVWRNAGVDRVSMGVQSFNDDELRIIGRRHDSRKALEAFDMLRQFFGNISIDLMFGLPGQTMETWKNTVETAVGLSPDHISAYSLMFEPGTPLTLLRDKGKISCPEDGLCVDMWRFLSDHLAEAGFSQYEISNYARPGKESVHNSRYWTQCPYLGIGPSAHSYDGDKIRRWNPSDIRGYMSRFSARGGIMANRDIFYNEEQLSSEELREEMILTRLRTREGLAIDEYRIRFGDMATSRLLDLAGREIDKGRLQRVGERLVLTAGGIMLSDEVILSLAL